MIPALYSWEGSTIKLFIIYYWDSGGATFYMNSHITGNFRDI